MGFTWHPRFENGQLTKLARSIKLSVSLCVSLSLSRCVSVCVSLSLTDYLCVCLMSVSLSIALSLSCISISLSLCLSVSCSLSVCLPASQVSQVEQEYSAKELSLDARVYELEESGRSSSADLTRLLSAQQRSGQRWKEEARKLAQAFETTVGGLR